MTARASELHELETTLAGSKRDLETQVRQIEVDRAALTEARAEHTRELERVAGLTADEAKAELLDHGRDAARAATLRSSCAPSRTRPAPRAPTQARKIVVEAVQRVASEQTAETVVSVLHLPADEMKGRIIGREGRNIRAFESVTGVNVIIDDTPEAVLLSCFDPVRREVGRLHPGEAGAGRPDPPAPHRGGLRAEQGRGRRGVPARRP